MPLQGLSICFTYYRLQSALIFFSFFSAVEPRLAFSISLTLSVCCFLSSLQVPNPSPELVFAFSFSFFLLFRVLPMIFFGPSLASYYSLRSLAQYWQQRLHVGGLDFGKPSLLFFFLFFV
jgi:hypothetical protein